MRRALAGWMRAPRMAGISAARRATRSSTSAAVDFVKQRGRETRENGRAGKAEQSARGGEHHGQLEHQADHSAVGCTQHDTESHLARAALHGPTHGAVQADRGEQETGRREGREQPEHHARARSLRGHAVRHGVHVVERHVRVHAPGDTADTFDEVGSIAPARYEQGAVGHRILRAREVNRRYRGFLKTRVAYIRHDTDDFRLLALR
jgi:hypothetical protein